MNLHSRCRILEMRRLMAIERRFIHFAGICGQIVDFLAGK